MGGKVDIDAILTERGSQYGSFVSHAEITQQLKSVVETYNKGNLGADMQEALDMICHKMGRIINGNPAHIDSWDDIAGYAKLVADRLRGVVR
jgi:hypothetical protein